VLYTALGFLPPQLGSTPFDPIQAVVAGMAGMVGGSTGASITAITMTFEMTRDYKTILPIIITTVLAHMTRKAISEDSIYTLKLVRRGHVVPEGLQAAVHAAQRVQDVMTSRFRVLSLHEPMTKYDGVTLVLSQPSAAPAAGGAPNSVNTSTTGAALARPAIHAVCGPVLVDYETLFGKRLDAKAHAAASGEREGDMCVALPSDDLHDAIRRMVAVDASVLLVSSTRAEAGELIGVVTKADISRNIAAKSQLMSRDRTLGVTNERITPL